MDRHLRVLLVTLSLVVGMFTLSGCPGNNSSQNIAPYSPYGPYSCVPGQACVTQTGATGYVHFQGNMGAINNSVAKQIIGAFYGVWNWCLGGCYNYSTIDVMITNGVANVNINLGGYPISGQGTISAINNNVGSDIQVIPFGPGARIDVISNNMLLDGSINAVPSVQVQYNGQNLGTTSLLRQSF